MTPTTKAEVVAVLKARCEDMIGAASVYPCLLGFCLTMKDGGEFHIQVTQLKEGKELK